MLRSVKVRSSFDAAFKLFFRHNSTDSAKQSLAISGKPKLKTTVDEKDVENHGNMSSGWWDLGGEMCALHTLNPLRIQFVRDGLANAGWKEATPSQPLQGLKILDVGCGGGILSEPLARIGANVTGIDASEQLIETAKEHATLDRNLAGKLSYVRTTVEETASAEPGKYDAVVASEILEHVSDQELFLRCCAETLKPGGSIFVTTLNKTLPSWLGGIIVAEHVLKLLPKGTHDWNKFISPEETRRLLESCGCRTKLIHGMLYNPLKNEWFWTSSTIISYAVHAIKN